MAASPKASRPSSTLVKPSSAKSIASATPIAMANSSGLRLVCIYSDLTSRRLTTLRQLLSRRFRRTTTNLLRRADRHIVQPQHARSHVGALDMLIQLAGIHDDVAAAIE